MNILYDILNPPEPLPPVTIKMFKDTRHRNVELAKAYTRIVTEIRHLLSRMSSTEHRTYLLTSYEVEDRYEDNVLFEFTCVLGEVRLSRKYYCYYLEFDTDSEIAKIVGGYNYRRLLRIAYRNTSIEFTGYDLEDWLFIETNMQNHYGYFQNRLNTALETNAIILEEDAVAE